MTPGPEGESESLSIAENYWGTRAAYPTGKFSSHWLVEAEKQDRKVRSAVPAGTRWYARSPEAPLALDPNAFTLIGPKPQQITSRSFGHVSGRVNSIAVDPVDTAVVYIAPVGGGVWKTTNCCSAATSWTVTTDKPHINTNSVHDIAIDPNDHNTVYASTGDLNFGSFSMGSAGILKTTDAGATWQVLGADVFNPVYPPSLTPTFPQYQAVGKVRVDPNDSSKVIAGAKTGVYFSYDAGTNWTSPCLTSGFTTQRQDVTAMATKSNGNGTTTLYVAIGTRGYATTVQPNLGNNGANGVYSTTIPASGCPASWTLLTTPANGWPVGAGSGVGCNPAIGTTNTCAVAANAVLNAGMETACATLPCNWSAGGDSAVTRDTATPHSGAASLQISDATSPGQAAGDCVAATGLGAYTASFWYRTTAAAVVSNIALTVDYFSDGACTTANGSGSVSTSAPVATGAWTQVTGTVTPAASTGSLRPRLSFDCTAGTCVGPPAVNFDDVTVEHGNPLGRIDLAIAPSDPSVMYAEVQSINPQSSCASNARGCLLGLWRTADAGATWTKQAATRVTSPCSGSSGTSDSAQNWYNQALAVSPADPNAVFVDIIEIWKSTDGGATIKDVSCGYGTGNVHVDQHALAFIPGSSTQMLAGNDGGIYYTANADAAMPTFIQLNDSLPTIEFYGGDISANFATSAAPFAVGGSQDNGSSSTEWAGTPTAQIWTEKSFNGDGVFGRIEPKLGQRVFLETQNGGLRRSTTGHNGSYSSVAPSSWGGDRLSFLFPYEIDKHDCMNRNVDPPVPLTTCDHMIGGTYRVWESITGGSSASWVINSPDLTKCDPPGNPCTSGLRDRAIINMLSYAYTDNRVAIVGTNDGNVQYGFGLGQGTANTATWVNVTDDNAVLPNRPILDVVTSPTDPLVGYAAVGGFSENTPSKPGHVYQVTCTVNCASFTWLDKTGNLPNVPADTIVVNPNVPTQVFVGTDWGLYFTNDVTVASPMWSRFDNGLPHVMIWELSIDRGATTLAAFTRSRSAYAWPLPTSGPTAVGISSFTARRLGKAVRLAWRTGSEATIVGFDVWRFGAGKAQKVNRRLIVATKAGAAAGASYSLRDRTVRRGPATYRLQLVHPSGKRTWAGRTSVAR